MPEKQMTPERAIIVLNNLNTDGRIEVNRDELRTAVKTAQEALRKQVLVIPLIIRDEESWTYFFRCPSCNRRLGDYEADHCRCSSCGQAFIWNI